MRERIAETKKNSYGRDNGSSSGAKGGTDFGAICGNLKRLSAPGPAPARSIYSSGK